jgi:hypothetical protein
MLVGVGGRAARGNALLGECDPSTGSPEQF